MESSAQALLITTILKKDVLIPGSRQTAENKRKSLHRDSAVKELVKMIGDGTAGIPTLFDGRYDCNSLHSPWWRDRSKSGGQVFEQVIHTYDLAMHFLGEPDTVSALLSNICHTDVPGYTIEDTGASIIKFRTGALASISSSNCAVPLEWNNTFTVICSNVTANFTDPNNAEFIFTGDKEAGRKKIVAKYDLYFEELKTFFDAVRGLDANICTVEEGLKSLCLADCVVKSSETGGQPVKYHFDM
jgi:predicted dehydrogenase